MQRNLIQRRLRLPASATDHRPVRHAPGTLGEQLAISSTALYLAERRGLRVRDVWQDARALVLSHATAEDAGHG